MSNDQFVCKRINCSRKTNAEQVAHTVLEKRHTSLPTTMQQFNNQCEKIIQSKIYDITCHKPTTNMYLHAQKRRIINLCFPYLDLKQENTFAFLKYYLVLTLSE